MNIEQLQKEIHQQNVDAGWWDDPNRCIYECLQLCLTEVAEATEGARKGLMDDHLPQYPMEWVELADTAIRLMDIGGRLDLHYLNELKLQENSELPLTGSIGSQHFAISQQITELGLVIYAADNLRYPSMAYTYALKPIQYLAKERGFDLETIIREKMEYNKHRADHKRENRAKEGGKKF